MRRAILRGPSVEIELQNIFIVWNISANSQRPQGSLLERDQDLINFRPESKHGKWNNNKQFIIIKGKLRIFLPEL